MTRLVNEAKQQLQIAARESAAQAVAAEARPLIDALHEQLREAAKQSVGEAVAGAAATVTEQAVQGVLDQTAHAGETQLRQLREQWDSTLADSIEQARRSLGDRIGEVEEQRRSAFLRELETETQKAVENLHRVTQEFQGKLGRSPRRRR